MAVLAVGADDAAGRGVEVFDVHPATLTAANMTAAMNSIVTKCFTYVRLTISLIKLAVKVSILPLRDSVWSLVGSTLACLRFVRGGFRHIRSFSFFINFFLQSATIKAECC